MLLAIVLLPLLGALVPWFAGTRARAVSFAAGLLGLLAAIANLVAVTRGEAASRAYLSADAINAWPAAAFEKGSLLPAPLLVNGHLGAFLLARVGLTLFPSITRDTFPMLANLALVTAALAALACRV